MDFYDFQIVSQLDCPSSRCIKIEATALLFGFVDGRNELESANQQPPQRGGAVPGPVWVGSKWLLAFPRVPVTPGTPHSFFRYAAP